MRSIARAPPDPELLKSPLWSRVQLGVWYRASVRQRGRTGKRRCVPCPAQLRGGWRQARRLGLRVFWL